MYSLHLTCRAEDVEQISFALWEMGTLGIRERECAGETELIAGFEDSVERGILSAEFAEHSPGWEREEEKDWVAATEESWPPRRIANRIFLAPVWNKEETPPGRVRVIHNPGLASGTGEHPCTQLALESLERCVSTGCRVVDVGTGSGILAVAALRLGAKTAVGLDFDLASLDCARENFLLNDFQPALIAGSVDCLASAIADVLVANISGTVLLSVADELFRIVRPGGWLIVTGFPECELNVLRQAFGEGKVSELNEWRCSTLRVD